LKIQDGGSHHLENHKYQTVKKLNFKNPRWRTAAILKIIKSPYLCNLLTDFD